MLQSCIVPKPNEDIILVRNDVSPKIDHFVSEQYGTVTFERFNAFHMAKKGTSRWIKGVHSRLMRLTTFMSDTPISSLILLGGDFSRLVVVTVFSLSSLFSSALFSSCCCFASLLLVLSTRCRLFFFVLCFLYWNEKN